MAASTPGSRPTACARLHLRQVTPDGGRTSGIFTGTSAERADTFPAPSTAATEYEYLTPGWPVLSMVCVVVTDLITLALR